MTKKGGVPKGSPSEGAHSFAGQEGTAVGGGATAHVRGSAVGYSSSAGGYSTALGAYSRAGFAPTPEPPAVSSSLIFCLPGIACLTSQFLPTVGYSSITMGDRANGAGTSSIALGTNAHAEGHHSIAIGTNAHAPNDWQVVIGSLNHSISIAGNLAFHSSNLPEGSFVTVGEGGNLTGYTGSLVNGNLVKSVV